RTLQTYMDLATGEYRRADGRPVMTRADFGRLEAAVRRMHALGWAWGDLHDGQILMRDGPRGPEFSLIDFGTLRRRAGPADAKFESMRADDLSRLDDLRASLFGASSADVGAARETPAPGRLEKAYARFNVRLGQGFYYATGGSFGILPRTFGENAAGDPLIILEKKTPPFSALLPARWREALLGRPYLSIGVNAAPDLASKKALIGAFGELTSPETLRSLGVGRVGGPAGFRVVTENPALVAFAKRMEGGAWSVRPYDEGAGRLDRAQHWMQHPYAALARGLASLIGRPEKDSRFVVSRTYLEEPPAVRPAPAATRGETLPALEPARSLPPQAADALRGLRVGPGENLLNAPGAVGAGASLRPLSFDVGAGEELPKAGATAPELTGARGVTDPTLEPPHVHRKAILEEITSPDSLLARHPGLASDVDRLETGNVRLRAIHDALSALPETLNLADGETSPLARLVLATAAERRDLATVFNRRAADPSVPVKAREVFAKAAKRYEVSDSSVKKVRDRKEALRLAANVLGEAGEAEVALRLPAAGQEARYVREIVPGADTEEKLEEVRRRLEGADPDLKAAFLAEARRLGPAADVRDVSDDSLRRLTLDKEIADVVFEDGRAWGEVKNLGRVTTRRKLEEGSKSILVQARENMVIRRLFGDGVTEYDYYFLDGIRPDAAAELERLGYVVHGVVK
ncbi:MAG: hypothetical protein KGL53_06050, partial [Elusimicrobia bacterium]|nr:hypothetical protein [Elusimicrobiota bacterium]